MDVLERGDGVDRASDAVVETVIASDQTIELTVRKGKYLCNVLIFAD